MGGSKNWLWLSILTKFAWYFDILVATVQIFYEVLLNNYIFFYEFPMGLYLFMGQIQNIYLNLVIYSLQKTN